MRHYPSALNADLYMYKEPESKPYLYMPHPGDIHLWIHLRYYSTNCQLSTIASRSASRALFRIILRLLHPPPPPSPSTASTWRSWWTSSSKFRGLLAKSYEDVHFEWVKYHRSLMNSTYDLLYFIQCTYNMWFCLNHTSKIVYMQSRLTRLFYLIRWMPIVEKFVLKNYIVLVQYVHYMHYTSVLVYTVYTWRIQIILYSRWVSQ